MDKQEQAVAEVATGLAAPRTRDAQASDAVAAIIVKGDFAKLTEGQRQDYYLELCRSLDLDPVTRPFEYLPLGGKLVIYATRNCAEQLRRKHRISIVSLTGQEMNGVYVVTVHGQDGTGRIDQSTGVVPIKGLQGEPLANALMKAETKAKRRLTLSIAGLGMLDESEIEGAIAAQREREPKRIESHPAIRGVAKAFNAEVVAVTPRLDEATEALVEELVSLRIRFGKHATPESIVEEAVGAVGDDPRRIHDWVEGKVEIGRSMKAKKGGLVDVAV